MTQQKRAVSTSAAHDQDPAQCGEKIQELVAEAISIVGGDLITCLDEVEEAKDEGMLSLVFRRIEEQDVADHKISLAGGIPNA